MGIYDFDQDRDSDRDRHVRALEASVKELTRRFDDLDIAIFDKDLERRVDAMEAQKDLVDKKLDRHKAVLGQVQLKQELLEDTFRRIINAGGKVDPTLSRFESALEGIRSDVSDADQCISAEVYEYRRVKPPVRRN